MRLKKFKALFYSFLLVAVMLVHACGGGTFLSPLEDAERFPVYSLGSGDKLRVTVFGEEDLSGEFTLDESGTVAMPLIGDVTVGNLSLREAEQRIAERLKRDYLREPRVSIEVLNYRPFYIIGEVKAPGSYPYVNGITVLNAIALGGGFTYRAHEDRISITRANDPTQTPRRASKDTPILPGDIIRVDERFF